MRRREERREVTEEAGEPYTVRLHCTPGKRGFTQSVNFSHPLAFIHCQSPTLYHVNIAELIELCKYITEIKQHALYLNSNVENHPNKWEIQNICLDWIGSGICVYV